MATGAMPITKEKECEWKNNIIEFLAARTKIPLEIVQCECSPVPRCAFAASAQEFPKSPWPLE